MGSVGAGGGKKREGPHCCGPSVYSNCSKFQQLKYDSSKRTRGPAPYTGVTMNDWITHFLHLFALPEYGLSTVFAVALISATLLPLGSEPVVLGLVHLQPDMFWPVIAVATMGNTLGGAITWWMGRAACEVADRYGKSASHVRALHWLRRMGPKACLLAWLPVVGDPLCAVAGWLKLPFWQCVAYMAVGKCLRYITMTAGAIGLISLW
jgi:membrane protein YqaA with SNARE-associated domain